MELKEKIGFIGVGNMGEAILKSLIQKTAVTPKNVWVYDPIEGKSELCVRRYKVNQASSNQDLVKSVKVILLAIKPQDLEKTAKEFSAQLKDPHVIISILAGTPISKIRRAVGTKPKIVRAMPNLGATVGESMTAITGEDSPAVEIAKTIFNYCGKAMELAEEHFDLVTALSGSGPAYFFLLMELLVKEGERHGLIRADAELLAAQTALGAGKVILESAENPAVWRERVTSKGGTTAAALKVFSDHKFEEIVQQAIQAAYDRGKELSQG